jgi:hypothetical protein
MQPVSPVMPGSEAIETVFGKDQPEYTPLPSVYLNLPSRPVYNRWRPTDEERAALVAGADVVLCQLTFNKPYHPTHMQVCHPDQMPNLEEQ